MKKLLKFIKTTPILQDVLAIVNIIRLWYSQYYLVTKFANYGLRHRTAVVRVPAYFDPKYVFLHEQTRLSNRTRVISSGGKFIMKKYSLSAVNLLVITGNHTPTVGIPASILVDTHINDKIVDVVVDEDVWMGANVTLLPGAHIGRGVVCGAGTTVNKAIPPYAVVVGTPAKIIASKFTINEIIEHERNLYDPEERLSTKYLEDLFKEHYIEKRSIGLNFISEGDLIKLKKFKEDLNL